MRIRTLSACLLAGASLLTPVRAQQPKPFLSPMFGSHMVLQRDIKAPVWGWAEPGAKVTVSVAGKTAEAVAGADGKWVAKVGPLKAGGPFTLTVSGAEPVTLDDVMVGDVWVASGQSNMQMNVGYSANAAEETAAAKYPGIRFFTVPNVTAASPQDTCGGAWEVCSPATVPAFSAAAYYFARELHKAVNVPIGIIHTSWGGTPAEAWTSAEALSAVPHYAPAVKQFKDAAADFASGRDGYDKRTVEWYAKFDAGTMASPAWQEPALNTDDWKTMKLPTAWEAAGLPDFDGVVWFRTEITLTAEAAAKGASLHLGPIDDRDTTYVNGVKVGGLDQWDMVRNYTVPASALRAGRNVIAIRVLDTGGAGGVLGKPDQLSFEQAGAPAISLAGDWKYKVGVDLTKTTPVPVRLDNSPGLPTVLYNSMIAPVLPYGIKGAIWYQGEANAGQAYMYRTLLPTMINDWRNRWGEGAFPFYIVQLANYMSTLPEPKDDAWAELREAQSMTAKTLPRSGIAVAIDIGDGADIHPKNKQEVGRRLALNALAKDYGLKVEYSGPDYKSMKVQGGKIRLAFSHIGGGLEAKGDRLTGFAIAGADRNFVWADAVIDGDTIVVSSPTVAEPVAVRYAWASNPICNLYNKAGLPASPFRTDTWPGITQPK